MIEKENVKKIVEEWLEGKDYFLTDLSIDENNRITVEVDHAEGVWIDDCVDLSRLIESRLDRDVEDYELEVGSAGIGQPFKVLQQYINHVGQEVEVVTLDGRKLHGVLSTANEKEFNLLVRVKRKLEGEKRPKMVEEQISFKYTDVKKTKLIIKF